jgi:hypothetical protein
LLQTHQNPPSPFQQVTGRERHLKRKNRPRKIRKRGRGTISTQGVKGRLETFGIGLGTDFTKRLEGYMNKSAGRMLSERILSRSESGFIP